jgi:hypothetical protein
MNQKAGDNREIQPANICFAHKKVFHTIEVALTLARLLQGKAHLLTF